MKNRFRLELSRRLAGMAAFVFVLAVGASASAQEARRQVEPSDEQLRLNDQAVEAIIEGNYARAVALLEEARLQGDVNIIYLNLGRAYQKLGNCDAAQDALRKARRAPVAAQPAPEVVDAKAQDYLSELAEACPDASSASAEKSEDQTPEGQTPEDQTNGAQANEVDSPSAHGPAVSTAQPWEWAVLGSGAAIALGGAGLHWLAESKRADVIDPGNYDGELNTTVTQQEAAALEQEANTLDAAALGMVVVGGLTVGAGTYLLLTGDEGAESSVWLEVRDGGASVVWGGRL